MTLKMPIDPIKDTLKRQFKVQIANFLSSEVIHWQHIKHTN